MADSNPQAWSVADPFDPMDPADQPPHFDQMDDFINFDNLDIDFNIGYSHAGPTTAHDTTQQQQQLADLNGNLDVQQHMQDAYSPAMPQIHGNGAPHSANQHNISGSGATSFFDFGVPQYSQASTPAYTPAQEHGFRPHSGVPPTPNSVEMHGDPNRYMQQMDPQQAIFDQRYQVRKDDATFTPLVSPAVTPHDGRFQIPEFTVPGAYFSPLTSPALNAQNQQPVPQHTSQYTTSGSSTGTSPVDVDMDILGEPAMAQPEQGRRLRSNRRNAPRSGNTTNRVRQSPVVRPGRRKATVQTLMPHPREVNELVEEARSNRMAANGLEVPGTRDSSETDSISPEPLSEMGPPPKPHSTTQSPAMVAQNQNGFNRGAISQAPATPSSLMRIQPSPNYGVPQDVPPLLDDLTLPEASLDRPQLSRGDTVIYNDDLETPQSSSRKTPKLNPLSTPSGASAMSGKPSPMLGPNSASTPTSPAFSMAGKKTDPKLARNTKKRNSISSNLISPALRPKISPSIKPLLPEGGVTDNTHALLLASKSNYQNILDGTTVPGVVYPTSLSTNLTSKRTSHKIAEQGRRNRINMALLEMQALLPSPQLGAKDAKSPETSALQSNNSKAAKVESAIEYIKQLKQECSEKDMLLDQKDQEVEALRKELAALRRSSSASDTPLKTEPASSPSSENAT